MNKPSQRIREAREAKGWSQEELARRANVSQQTIAKIENGTIVRSRSLPIISRFLDIPLEELDNAYAIENNPLPDNRAIGVYTTIPGRGRELLWREEPLYYAHRPEPLFDVEGAFALIVGNNSLDPIAKPGDILLCGNSPTKKLADGPSVIVGHKIEELNGLRPIVACISILDVEDKYILERADTSEIVPQADWQRISKVYGVFFRR